MTYIHEYFTLVDWIVLIGYLVGTTWFGHMMRGSQNSIRDFFLAGKSLPWPAVSASIVATEISGVTFIGVAGSLFALKGDCSYLIWGVGSILARIVVAKYFVPLFYQRSIYSPYDYIGARLGNLAKLLTTLLFLLGNILGQSVRVFVAALPLHIVTAIPLVWCIIIIGIIAIIWTLLGGMRTVIWTDVMQFLIFVFGGLFVIGYLWYSLDGSFFSLLQEASWFQRTKVLHTTFSFDSTLQFTLWIAILCVPFQNLAIYGVDQLNAQRIFCCKNSASAAKAIIWSSVGQAITLIMLIIGCLLFVHYQRHGFAANEVVVLANLSNKLEQKDSTMSADAKRLLLKQQAEQYLEKASYIQPTSPQVPVNYESKVPVIPNRDSIFPVWIVKTLPAGISGLIIAAIFAAAISSLDSILAALSQTTLSLIYHPENKSDIELEQLNLVTKSRWLIIFWGIILTMVTLLIIQINRQGIKVLPLAFGLTIYTAGPLLAIFIAAIKGWQTKKGIVIGVMLSLCCAALLRVDFPNLIVLVWQNSIDFFQKIPTYTVKDNIISPKIGYPWVWPLTTILTLVCIWLCHRCEKLTDTKSG